LRRDAEFLDSARQVTELAPKATGWAALLAAGYLVAEPPLYDPEAALAFARQAVQLAPGTAPPHTVLGYALFVAGKPEDAAREFAEARRLRPPPLYDAQNLFGQALCARAAGDLPRARAAFADAIAVKDAGRFNTALAERLHERMYAEAAQALGLPAPPAGR
jgi:tetratricopeptide (TPR) repeat protein